MPKTFNQCLDSSYAIHVLKKHCHDVSEVEGYDISIASDSYSSEAKEDPCEKHPKIDLGDSLQSISTPPSELTACQNMSKSHMHMKRSVMQ